MASQATDRVQRAGSSLGVRSRATAIRCEQQRAAPAPGRDTRPRSPTKGAPASATAKPSRSRPVAPRTPQPASAATPIATRPDVAKRRHEIASGTMFEPAAGMPVADGPQHPDVLDPGGAHPRPESRPRRRRRHRLQAHDPPTTADEEEGRRGQRQQLDADGDGEEDPGDGRSGARFQASRQSASVMRLRLPNADLGQERQVRQDMRRPPSSVGRAAAAERGRARRRRRARSGPRTTQV